MTHYQPPGPPPWQQPKKKSLALPLLIGAGVLGLLCCGGIAVVASSGSDTPPSTTSAAGTGVKEAPEALPGLNTPVRDGKFEFTVTGVECGKAEVGDQYFTEAAQGEFCLVSAKVANIGDQAQFLMTDSQKAYDAAGREYSTDSAAEIYLQADNPTWIEEINPGNSVEGTFIFDVPKGTKLTKLKLHDSLFSGGVEVSLG